MREDVVRCPAAMFFGNVAGARVECSLPDGHDDRWHETSGGLRWWARSDQIMYAVQEVGSVAALLRHPDGAWRPAETFSFCPSCGHDLGGPVVVETASHSPVASPPGEGCFGCVRPGTDDHTCELAKSSGSRP